MERKTQANCYLWVVFFFSPGFLKKTQSFFLQFASLSTAPGWLTGDSCWYDSTVSGEGGGVALASPHLLQNKKNKQKNQTPVWIIKNRQKMFKMKNLNIFCLMFMNNMKDAGRNTVSTRPCTFKTPEDPRSRPWTFKTPENPQSRPWT